MELQKNPKIQQFPFPIPSSNHYETSLPFSLKYFIEIYHWPFILRYCWATNESIDMTNMEVCGYPQHPPSVPCLFSLCSARYARQLIVHQEWMCHSSPAELPLSLQASLRGHCTGDKQHWLSFPRRREGCLDSPAVGESNELKMPTGFEK